MGWATLRAEGAAKAETHFLTAIDMWETIRGQIKTGKERTGFQATLPLVYSGLAAVRLSQGKPEEAFEAIERGRGKVLDGFFWVPVA